MTKTLPRISFVEFKILVLLSEKEMHVNALRRALGDYGAVSKYLVHLEKMGFTNRRELDKSIINKITPKGREVLKCFSL